MRLTTAVTIIPPMPVQMLAVPLLRKHAYDHIRRLPAHVTVLYPFVEPSKIDDTCEKLRDICAEIPPFNLTLSGYGTFPLVTYMRVNPSSELENLTERVHAAFPECLPYDGHFGERPPAHMTVGIFNTQSKQAQAEFPDYEAQTFRIDRLHVSVGAELAMVNWLVQDVIRLGAKY